MKWKQKNGEEIDIKDMSNSHLQNSINMLNRKLEEIGNPWVDYPSFGGEMAQICAEREWENSISIYEGIKEKIKNLQNELKWKTQKKIKM